MREHTDTGAGTGLDTGADTGAVAVAVAAGADSVTGRCDSPSIALDAAFGAGVGTLVGAIFGTGLASVASYNSDNSGAISISSLIFGAFFGAFVGSASNRTLLAAEDERFRCATTCAAAVFAGAGAALGSKIDSEMPNAIYSIFGAAFAALVVGSISHAMVVFPTVSSVRDSDSDIGMAIGRPANVTGVSQNVAGAGAPSGSHESRCNQRAASSFTR